MADGYHYRIVESEYEDNYPEIEADLVRRGVRNAQYAITSETTKSRMYRVPNLELPKLFHDDGAPFLTVGEGSGGFALFPDIIDPIHNMIWNDIGDKAKPTTNIESI